MRIKILTIIIWISVISCNTNTATRQYTSLELNSLNGPVKTRTSIIPVTDTIVTTMDSFNNKGLKMLYYYKNEKLISYNWNDDFSAYDVVYEDDSKISKRTTHIDFDNYGNPITEKTLIKNIDDNTISMEREINITYCDFGFYEIEHNYIDYDFKDKNHKTTDNTTITSYKYDINGKLKSMITKFTNNLEDAVHQNGTYVGPGETKITSTIFTYNELGFLSSAEEIYKNDTIFFKYKNDNRGNPIEEITYFKGKLKDSVRFSYTYYN